MRILVINPNTSMEMTTAIKKTVQNLQTPSLEIDVVSNGLGVASIEGYTDEAVSTMGVLEIVVAKQNLYDGFLIACFSNHPAINCCRELITQPVIGIFEASVGLALMLGNKFSIITSSSRWVPLLTEGVTVLGLKDRLASVRSTGLAVLELAKISQTQLIAKLESECLLALKNDQAEVLCLGCAGMAGLAETLANRLKVPVIDGIPAGIKLLEALISLSLTTSKLQKYQFVEPRETKQLSEIISSIYQSN